MKGVQLTEEPLTSQECGDRNKRTSNKPFKLKTLHLLPVWSVDDAGPAFPPMSRASR
jgi:hypothetical protein